MPSLLQRPIALPPLLSHGAACLAGPAGAASAVPQPSDPEAASLWPRVFYTPQQRASIEAARKAPPAAWIRQQPPPRRHRNRQYFNWTAWPWARTPPPGSTTRCCSMASLAGRRRIGDGEVRLP